MKILHRILKYVKIDVRKPILTVNLRGMRKSGMIFRALDKHWKANLNVNLRGMRKSGVIFKSIRQALESYFECKFTWYAQVWGDFHEH